MNFDNAAVIVSFGEAIEVAGGECSVNAIVQQSANCIEQLLAANCTEQLSAALEENLDIVRVIDT